MVSCIKKILWAPRCKILLLLTLLAANCQPSSFLVKQNVTYNFTTEGFLSPNVLQTVGQAEIESRRYGGSRAAHRLCLNTALRTAKERSLRVMLHTHFDVRPGQERSSGVDSGDFARDYPLDFSERDLIRAELDFRDLLEQGFIALQDNRSRASCSVVFRIEGEDLPAQIRSVSLTFRPENLERWQRKQAEQLRRPEPEPGTTDPNDPLGDPTFRQDDEGFREVEDDAQPER